MSARDHEWSLSPAAIREVHLEQANRDLADLHGYRQAFVVFRLRGAVVGQAWLPVQDGRISAAKLRSSLAPAALPIWRQLMAGGPSPALTLPTATVVVCTCDRAADLAHCLPGLSALAAQGHEVIVVDNCPRDDSTERLVATYQAIRYLQEPRQGLDIARNRGLRAAKGEIVAFTDDDAVIDPGWLTALLQNFDGPLVAVVTGVTMPLELETQAQLWFESTNGFGRGFVRRCFEATNFNVLAPGPVGAGVNMAIRRCVVEEVGYFDEALDGGTPTCSGGDQEYFYRVLARGHRIIYEPAALIWHRHRREWAALRHTIHGYGVGVFAWWTRALLVEAEWTLLWWGSKWFFQHHVRNLVSALLRRAGGMPLDLAYAEFSGALAGPARYLRSRYLLRKSMQKANMGNSAPLEGGESAPIAADRAPVSTADPDLEAR